MQFTNTIYIVLQNYNASPNYYLSQLPACINPQYLKPRKTLA